MGKVSKGLDIAKLALSIFSVFGQSFLKPKVAQTVLTQGMIAVNAAEAIYLSTREQQELSADEQKKALQVKRHEAAATQIRNGLQFFAPNESVSDNGINSAIGLIVEHQKLDNMATLKAALMPDENESDSGNSRSTRKRGPYKTRGNANGSTETTGSESVSTETMSAETSSEPVSSESAESPEVETASATVNSKPRSRR